MTGVQTCALPIYGKTDDDTPTGFAMQLDRTYSAYFALVGVTVDPEDIATYDVPDGDAYCFEQYLSGLIYDSILPSASLTSDFSVDAPLTNIKRSQLYRQIKDLRDDAWSAAASCGYTTPGVRDFVGGFKVNLDFNEPSIGHGSSEFG